MPLDTLNADHIGQAGGGFEPQRQNNGLLYITGLEGDENGITTLSFVTGPVPKSDINVVEVHHQNQLRKFAGKTTYQDMTVQFYDYVDQNTKLVLTRWYYQSHDPKSGKTRFASRYKKNGRLVLTGPDGSTDREWAIEGMWIQGFDPGDIDHESDTANRISCTIAIDKAIYVPAIGFLATA